MSLPPALLARLQKRGIIQKKSDPEEEIIAESYDAPTASEKTAPELFEEEIAYEDLPRSGAPGCPNKWNPYHLCVEFCYEFWGDGTPESRLSDDYLNRRARMLRLYPLPDGWNEVYDPGFGRHYYWCPKTDEVSWLSPRHPRAIIGDSGPNLARELKAKGENFNGINRPFTRKRRLTDLSDDKGSDESGSDDDDNDESEQNQQKEMNDHEKLKKAKRRGIDPMDPAAYGDNVPLGGWGSGLDENRRNR